MRKQKPKFKKGQVVYDKEYKTFVKITGRSDGAGWVKVLTPHGPSEYQISTLRKQTKLEKGD